MIISIMTDKINRQTGFTIVELLIAIVIIGILAAITIVAYNGVQQRAKVAMVVSDLRNSATRLGLDRVDLGGYPATVGAANSNLGLKASPGTTYQLTVDNAVNPQTFCLTATNGGIDYMVTQGTAPVIGVCPGHLASGIPATVADNFNRTAGTLGVTSTGTLPWTALSGTWSTNGTTASTTASDASNPLATINFATADVDASVDVSSGGGGDSLIVRASDASNYIRARYYHNSTYVSSGYWGGWGYYQGPTWNAGGWSADANGCGTTLGGPYYSNTSTLQYQYSQVYPTQVAGIDCSGDGSYRYQNNYWTDTSYNTYSYSVYLEKVVAGVSTTLYTGNIGSSVSKLRLTTTGSTIKLYVNGSAAASTTLTEAFNQTVVNHGIGRGATGNYTTSAIDNYSIIRN